MLSTFLNQLVASGISESEIGKLIGRDQSSVNRMRHGKQRADYETGVKIERLYRQRCKRQGRRAA